jgi:hypothetical protein
VTGLGHADLLVLEELALDRGADRVEDRDPGAGLPGLAEDALPRDAIGRLRGSHRGPGDPGAARDPGELGDLAIRRDPAAWNAAHHRIDRAVQPPDVLGLAGRHLAMHASTGS